MNHHIRDWGIITAIGVILAAAHFGWLSDTVMTWLLYLFVAGSILVFALLEKEILDRTGLGEWLLEADRLQKEQEQAEAKLGFSLAEKIVLPVILVITLAPLGLHLFDKYYS